MKEERRGSGERRADQWHIKKEMTYGHLLTTAMLFMGIISAWTTLDKRLVTQEVMFTAHAEMDADRDSRHSSMEETILGEIRELRKDLHKYMLQRAETK